MEDTCDVNCEVKGFVYFDLFIRIAFSFPFFSFFFFFFKFYFSYYKKRVALFPKSCHSNRGGGHILPMPC